MTHKEFDEYCDKSCMYYSSGLRDGEKVGFLWGIILSTILATTIICLMLIH